MPKIIANKIRNAGFNNFPIVSMIPVGFLDAQPAIKKKIKEYPNKYMGSCADETCVAIPI